MTILRLGEVGRQAVAVAGVKGANLGELTRWGMPVPPGFVIAAQVYSKQAAACGLAETLAPLIDSADWAGAEAAALRLLTSGPLEPALREALLDAFRGVGAAAVAVRSSATAEDLADASFAGQYATFLNVGSEPEFLKAVRKCWASLWSRQALHYRHRRSIDHSSVQMAVVVQEMVDAELAGVLFTVDPVAQRADRILVEVVRGLGDTLVSGKAPDERYRVDRQSLEPVEHDGDRRLLGHGPLRALCQMALEVEAHLGAPQDIEYAVQGGGVHLLQARPMTALRGAQPEVLPELDRPSRLDTVVEPIGAERYVLAPRPLDNITFTRFVGALARAICQFGGTLAPADEAAFRKQIWRQAYRLPRVRLSWRVLGSGWRQLRLLGQDWVGSWRRGPGNALRALSTPAALPSLSDAALLERADEILAVWEDALCWRFGVAAAMGAEWWLKLLVHLAVGGRECDVVLAHLMTGLESPAIEVNRALWDLSRLARRDPQIRRAVREASLDLLPKSPAGLAFIEAFRGVLGRYGDREGVCCYLSTPNWRRDPRPVWGFIDTMAEADNPPAGPEEAQARYRSARARVEGRLRLWPVLPRLFGWLVGRLRALHAFREASHLELMRPLGLLQEIASEWGRRLEKRGALESAGDVYDLTHDEVRRWLLHPAPPAAEIRALVARRRATYLTVNARWQAWRFRPPAPDREAKGVAVSPGFVRGRARIIRGEHQFHRLEAGEVIVCPQTNPAWTPLFASAAAVVTETGGAASHAAVVAREYGIPAVMGVPGATGLFEDGMHICVDGDRGLVHRA